MRIVLVLKPYAIEVYSEENSVYTLVGIEHSTRIENESLTDYEKRMIFIAKDLCSDMRASPFFKAVAKKVESIQIILCAPWCTYDVVQVEKDFGKPVKIDEKLLASMKIKKSEDEVFVVESYTSNMMLNGYTVKHMAGHMAQHVHFQYVHIYANASFATSLIKSMESIFHTHKVVVKSVYGLVEGMASAGDKAYTHEMRIILEEESVDIAYISEGLHIVNTFVPHSYMHVEDDIAMKLSSNHEVVGKILQSRYESFLTNTGVNGVVDKNAKKLWPDLDVQTQAMINASIEESIEKVLVSIRNCIDGMGAEYTKDFISVRIFCLHKRLLETYGFELSQKIHNDPYIAMKIHVTAETITVNNIF